jgi:flagellar hook-associated protein 3 FlgL
MTISRVSTNQYYKTTIERMSVQQKNLADLQGKMATSQRVLKPSDDPVAMATAMGAKANVKTIESYQANITYLNNQLSQMDTALGSASDLMSNIKQTMIQAGNPTLSRSDLDTLVLSLQGNLEELQGLANTKDPNGNYLFSGTYEQTEPYQTPSGSITGTFLETATPAAAAAVTGRSIQVSGGRSIDLSITGNDAFADPATGTDVFSIMRTAISYLQNASYPNGMATASTTYKQEFNSQMAQLDNVFDQTQLARTKVGVRLQEIDTLQQINDSASLEQERVAGEAVGLDYAKAISDLSQGQLQLQASQQSFASTSKLSLFNFIN